MRCSDLSHPSPDVNFVSAMHFDPLFLDSPNALLPRPVAPLFSTSNMLPTPTHSFDIPRVRSSPPRTPATITPSITARVDYPSRGAEVWSVLPSHSLVNEAYRPRVASKASIPHLREALNSLDSKMASLMSQREELETHLEQAVRLQSPVQRLPCEILASIFVIGVFKADDEDPLMVSTLMLVCRYWADVAVNTPVLWSNITVNTHNSLEKARRKLQRSKSCPLDITINFSPRQEHSYGVTESVIHAMDLVRPALWRTKSFRLSVPNRPQAHAALLRCQEDAPHLEFLSIRIFHSMQEDHYSTPQLPLFNGHTPRLRSCSFTSFNFGWDIQAVTRLRVLKLGGYWNGFSPSVPALLRILSECPELEEFALRNLSDVDPQTCGYDQARPPNKLVHLPRLVKASFYYAGITRTRTILNQISFPALQTLELCYLDDLTPLLERLKQQSLTSFPLRSLRVESSFFNEMKFANLLSRLHSLVCLEIVDCEDASSHFLKALTTSSASSIWVCPKLETLNLDGCTNLDWDSLRTFVECRLPGRSHAYPLQLSNRPHPNTYTAPMSSASVYAQSLQISIPPNSARALLGPKRLHSIDVTRCHQISKEMVQWLRMYVTEVKCEPAKGVWGEPVLP